MYGIYRILSYIVHFIHTFIHCIHAKKNVITDKNDEMKISREKIGKWVHKIINLFVYKKKISCKIKLINMYVNLLHVKIIWFNFHQIFNTSREIEYLFKQSLFATLICYKQIQMIHWMLKPTGMQRCKKHCWFLKIINFTSRKRSIVPTSNESVKHTFYLFTYHPQVILKITLRIPAPTLVSSIINLNINNQL